jgi:hypothetical protein
VLFEEAWRIFNLKNGGRTVQTKRETRNVHPAASHKRTKIVQSRRDTMQAMKTSIWMDRVGHGFFNAMLLAALPTAAVALIIQSL